LFHVLLSFKQKVEAKTNNLLLKVTFEIKSGSCVELLQVEAVAEAWTRLGDDD
jgi:hypothetical protein